MPRIGLLSDTHGRAALTRRAVALLLAEGVQRLLHLGDVGSLSVLDELVIPRDGGILPVHVVFGNTDEDLAGMGRYAADLGLRADHPMGRLSLGERELVFLHGDDHAAMQAALAQRPAYLCHGHTHRPRDERRGQTRLINPGALCRANPYTAALLDTDHDALRFLAVPGA
jgi:putative phosphoesterase